MFRNRRVRVELIDSSHMRWLWAAYRKGLWQDVAGSELDQEAFAEFVATVAEGLSEAFIITAPNETEDMPVAVGSVIERSVWLEPHLDFFPWATPRNKIEAAVKFALEMRKIKPLFIAVERKHQSWTDHILRYGVISRSGTHNPTNRVLYESGVKNVRST